MPRIITLAKIMTLIFAAYSVARLPSLLAAQPGEFVSYYTAGYGYAHGYPVEEFYQPEFFQHLMDKAAPGQRDQFYPNPPVLAVLAAPLASLPFATMRLIWNIFNVGVCVLLASLLLHEAGLKQAYAWIFIATALAFQPMRANVSHGQLYGILSVGVFFAWKAARRMQWRRFSLALASLIGFKLFGMWLVLMGLRSGAKRAWAYLGICLLALMGLSLLALPPSVWMSFASNSISRTVTSGTLYVTPVQSLNSLFHRLFTLDPQWNPHPLLPLPGVGSVLSVTTTLLLTGIAAWLAFRTSRSSDGADARTKIDLAFAALCILCVVASPFAQDYTYIVLLIPSAICIRQLQLHSSTSGLVIVLIGLALIGTPYPFRSPLIANGALVLLAYAKVYGAVLLFLFTVKSSYINNKVPAATTVETGVGSI